MITTEQARRGAVADYVLHQFAGPYAWRERDCLLVASLLLQMLTGIPLDRTRLAHWHAHETEPLSIKAALREHGSLANAYRDLLTGHRCVEPVRGDPQPGDLVVVTGEIAVRRFGESWDGSDPSRNHLGFVDGTRETRVWTRWRLIPIDPGFTVAHSFRAPMSLSCAGTAISFPSTAPTVTVSLADILPGGARESRALLAWAKTLKEGDFPLTDPEIAPRCVSVYAAPVIETLIRRATPHVEKLLGVGRLYPVNTFMRWHRNGASLARHLDRDELLWTLSMPLVHDGPGWPLQTPEGPSVPMTEGVGARQRPGDGALARVLRGREEHGGAASLAHRFTVSLQQPVRPR